MRSGKEISFWQSSSAPHSNVLALATHTLYLYSSLGVCRIIAALSNTNKNSLKSHALSLSLQTSKIRNKTLTTTHSTGGWSYTLYCTLHLPCASLIICMRVTISRAARDDLNNLDGELLVAWADDRLVLLALRLEVSTWRVDDCARARQEERGTQKRQRVREWR